MPENAEQHPAGEASALPSVRARAVAFAVIVVGGICGLLIGRALVSLQCSGPCSVEAGLGALAGAILGAGGVSVVAVLALRAMGDWQASGSRPPGA